MKAAAVTLLPWVEKNLLLLEQLLGAPEMMEHLGGPETPEQIHQRHLRYLRLPEKDHMFTMLFIDIRGSTALSEKVSPTKFRKLIDRFYTATTKIIIEEDGLVEKLAGDEVAAFWGAGFAGPDYVVRTIKVAQRLLKAMEQEKIPVGVGVHAGVAYFGAIGTAEGLTDISATGDEVNTAARLASKAAPGEIIVSEQAFAKAGMDGSGLEARSLELKGISQPVSVRVMHN